jgi:anti-sigma factor RsiW
VASNHPNRKSSRHIGPEQIAAFLGRNLSPGARKTVIKHLADCPRCRTLLAKAAQSQKSVHDPTKRFI